uniref:Contactin-2 n=1 Tax=Cyanoderma ruficeps TaxID=181631 RepID=A0A8C3XG04_9PASS
MVLAGNGRWCSHSQGWAVLTDGVRLSPRSFSPPRCWGHPTKLKRRVCCFLRKIEAGFSLFFPAVWCQAQSGTRSYGPVFEEQPAHTLFPEGSAEEKVTLGCRARANPPATYRWKMNGTELRLEPDSRYRLVAGDLVISNPTKAKDSGSYQCVASNPRGTVVSREASLRFGFLQEFSAEERDPVRITEGWGVMFTCSPPPHYPGLSYRWLLNEFPNFIPADGRRFISQTTGNLYIAKTEASDTGNYSCFATSHIDFITKSVFSPLSGVFPAADVRQFPPSIKARFPVDTYALTGQAVTLECFAFGNPVPRIKWRKLDGPQSSKWIGSEPLLQIQQAGFEDEGTYECEAENAKGRDTHQGRIIIHAQPEWLDVISDTEADIGSDLRWSCVASGKPRPTVRWLRDGQPLTSQNRIEVRGGELRFSRLVQEDSGMYQCVAENKHGTVYASAELTVQALAPDFRLNPVKRLIPAARSGKVIIPCQPRAAPKATVLWTKGTELLVNSSRVTITADGTLILQNISKSDEGKYTCFAENPMGKANSTGILSVRDATKITLAPSSADINVGENLTLQCHASHDPTMDLTFTWSLDDFPIDFDKSEGHYRRASAIGDLSISNAQLRHSGRYTCTAQTVVDSASESATLTVRGPPGPPGGVVVRDIGDTSVQLSWSRGFDNHSPIARYLIEARTLLSSQWKQMRTNPVNIEGNAETAQVVNLIPWMDYEFRVLASNILGIGEPSLPSSKIRTKEAGGPDEPEADLSGPRLPLCSQPTLRDYQNGDGFGYIVSFRRKGSQAWLRARVPHAESLHFVYRNESIAPYTPFEVKIKAYNRKGEGPESLTAIVYSAEEEPKAAPYRVIAKSVLSSEMDVSWEPVEQGEVTGVLLGYEIRYWKDGDKEEAADRVRTAGLVTSAHVTGLNPNTVYHVSVRAYNRAGTGPPSPSTNVTTTRPPPKRPPGNISWSFSGSTVSIKWDPVVAKADESAVTGYKVRSPSGQAPVHLLPSRKDSATPLPSWPWQDPNKLCFKIPLSLPGPWENVLPQCFRLRLWNWLFLELFFPGMSLWFPCGIPSGIPDFPPSP